MRFVADRRGSKTYHEGGLRREHVVRQHPARTACEGVRWRDTAMDTSEISDWRLRIDALDEQIVKLLCERAACAIAIGEIKQGKAAPIYEPRREQQVYDHVRAANPGPLKGVQVQDIYERIMDVMRSLQRPGASAGERWRPPAKQEPTSRQRDAESSAALRSDNQQAQPLQRETSPDPNER